MATYHTPIARERYLSRYYRIEVDTIYIVRRLLRELYSDLPEYQEAIFDFLEDTKEGYLHPRKDSRHYKTMAK